MAESIIVAIVGAVGAIIVAIIQRAKRKADDDSPSQVVITPEDHERIVDELQDLVARQGRLYSSKLESVETRLDGLEQENRNFADLLSRAFELLGDILTFESDLSDSMRQRIKNFMSKIRKEEDDGPVSPQ